MVAASSKCMYIYNYTYIYINYYHYYYCYYEIITIYIICFRKQKHIINILLSHIYIYDIVKNIIYYFIYYTILHYIILHYNILHYNILHYIILHYIYVYISLSTICSIS